MSKATHEVVVHRRAIDEFERLETEYDVDDLKERIKDAAACRQPKNHPTAEPLAGFAGFLKVRGDGIRAICELAKPQFRVLLVDKRRRVYDRIGTAIQRADDDGGAF